ncbi:MAG: type III pantothenate kinase [Paludibacter sp.]|nr:type III pantothenate kinase [Bacteroidales bacterium]MCM1069103.1 type III pantothenate kinase [Prevotella sp.]MCM1353542.1 type III pantothenate kinase [Bacteroides sp.]MCM1442703.1 type III pantothenate kinase [Muribaculum sp.]MCM1481661.1 type III pantothenate kinase [Paludibacter sp.]
MNLCIDQGNSRTKVALFQDDERLLKTFIYKSFTSVDAERLFSLYPVSDCIISSVAHTAPAVINALHRHSRHFVLFDHTTPVPIENKYDTPQTLGQDRLAAAVGANYLCPNENLLIIDAGSAITYDYVNDNNQYIGGNIAPGIKMRLSVLRQMTKRLPAVEVEEHQLIPLFGKNTRDAIAAGVLRGVTFEVKGYMRTLQERVEHFQTFLTGGNAPYISANLQTEVRMEKHLVLIGLNHILEYSKS